LDLIYSEVLLREQRGEQPALAEYLERFPDLADQLRLQFELDEVVQPTDTISERPGTVVGRYTLLEQLGEGGMGVVYVAQQERPVTRQVALKIIKPGMDTKEVIARFEAERQALALMDHSHIARVFDAGATASGRPYFVMELVHGKPITDYCDQNNLTIIERLELFVQVCHAVQHAHQKGIIHRDLKPSNVLVTQHEGHRVPKIIDFGLAKATGLQLTDKTLLTVYPQMMGTPVYMSPEQAEMTTLDIDTRADVYSLGVMLYELLTGATPFDPTRLRKAGFDEVRRIIREEEPPRPSMRIRVLGPAVATHRGTDVRRLHQLVNSDLDWIVMRCLEKDRARRYGTASALALDIERYLRDEPVEACPPTRAYRLRKFIRRNKAGVLAGTAIVAY
jgi:serine/threonine protein kinase